MHQLKMGLKVPQAEFSMNHIKEKAIILFDDSIYSGTQLNGNLRRILANQTEKKSVYLVIPFMSKKAMEIAESYKKGLDLHIFTSDERILTVDDIFSEEELADFNYLTNLFRKKFLVHMDLTINLIY